MGNCKICNNKGYTHNEDGQLILCHCQLRSNHNDYLRPLRGLFSPSNKPEINLSALANCNQIITNTVENIAGLIKLMLSDWFPEDYVITTLEELNDIGFKGHPVFKSIYEFASRYRYFIVDITQIINMRAKSNGWNTNDSMCLLDLVKTIIQTQQKIVIVINPSIANFARSYRELCNGLNDFGIEYFHTGKYKKIPTNDDANGENNE